MRSLLFPLALLLPTGAAAAPAPVVALEALPPTVVLDRPQTRQPVLVLGRRADGTQEDLTRFARYRMAGDGVAGVSRTGEVFPLRNGETYLDVRAPGRTTVRLRVSVQVRNAGPRYRWDFATHIAPLLTRAGCNGTGCHGNVLGRGGFRLAAFGHDPEWDYSSLVRAGGGRRVFRQNPGASLLLLKATLAVPHGGGRRFAVDSPEYRTFAAWIADGAPRGESGSDVRRIQILPEQRLLSRPRERQRLLVRAWYGDGTREDVTHLALLESRNTGVVEVEAAELVAAGLGETRLLARFAGRTALAQVAATSLGPLRTRIGYDPANPVDREVLGRLLRLGLAPAPPAADGEWLRKVYLDLIGRIPTAEELDAFLAETDPQKRQRVVDHLLAGPEYARHWRENLNALLMGRSPAPPPTDWGDRLEAWLREDRGWDRMARELLLGSAGPDSPTEAKAALRFLDSRFAQGETGLDAVTRDVSRIFFGVDLQCARCHAHPEVAQWQQDAYWGLAAFYGRTYRIQVAKAFYLAERAAGDVDYFGSDQEKRLARPVFLTGERPVEPRHTLPPAPPGATGPPAEPADLFRVAPEEAKEKTRVPVPHYSRREAFVRLAVGGNPYFRRALVNRIWAMLLGRGLVEPVDQMHGGNPATHPELLETLAADFGSNGYSLKRLLRTLVLSRTYGLSSRWPGGSPPAPELYAVSLVRPQSLPQLAASTLTALGYWDRSLRQATEKGGGKGSAGPALDAVRAAFETTFAQQQEELRRRLDTGTELFLPGVSQALYLTNGPAFQELVRQGGLVARLASLPDPEAIRAAYRAILSREPEVEERAAFERHLVSRRERRPAAVEQMVWALLTSSEFRFVH